MEEWLALRQLQGWLFQAVSGEFGSYIVGVCLFIDK